MSESATKPVKGERRLVWDLPLRLFHWLLVISLFLLWFTQWLGYERMRWVIDPLYLEWITIHMWLGYWTLGLIIFRVLWGFVGPKHARFCSFIPTPKRMIRYLRGQEPKPVGHNPLGSLMVFVMLALIATQATTGLFISDDAVAYGPYYGVGVVSPETERLFGIIHHSLFNYIIAAIVLHVSAIIVYAVVLKQNLVGPMVHGKKAAAKVPAGEEIPSSALLRALIVIVIAAATVTAIVRLAPLPDYGF